MTQKCENCDKYVGYRCSVLNIFTSPWYWCTKWLQKGEKPGQISFNFDVVTSTHHEHKTKQ